VMLTEEVVKRVESGAQHPVRELTSHSLLLYSRFGPPP
jgi:hypothetical protein